MLKNSNRKHNNFDRVNRRWRKRKPGENGRNRKVPSRADLRDHEYLIERFDDLY